MEYLYQKLVQSLYSVHSFVGFCLPGYNALMLGANWLGFLKTFAGIPSVISQKNNFLQSLHLEPQIIHVPDFAFSHAWICSSFLEAGPTHTQNLHMLLLRSLKQVLQKKCKASEFSEEKFTAIMNYGCQKVSLLIKFLSHFIP